MGQRKNTVQNMVKILSGSSLEQYYVLAPRDRPEDESGP